MEELVERIRQLIKGREVGRYNSCAITSVILTLLKDGGISNSNSVRGSRAIALGA